MMGGRGSSSPGSRHGVLTHKQLEALPYNVVSYDDALGGAVYPFLEATGRAWRLLTRPVGEEAAYHAVHTLGRDRPTLRWVNGEQVNDLYVDGMDTEQFLAATGLRLDLHKGAFVLSKRLSRLMRPHFVSGFFAPDEVRIAYMEQDEREAKIWDGAGLISRRMLVALLRRMALSDGLSSQKRDALLCELKRAGRVEFTVMTPAGQDKGHAIVAEDLRDDQGNPVDFLLPRDTKREVRLENAPTSVGGQTFVGLSFVHGRNQMRLDIQSLINLHPFFEGTQLLGWLRDEGQLFVRSIEDGTAGAAMARIDGEGRIARMTLAELQSWPLREYLASGGHPLWFRSHVKSLMNQHLERLSHTTLEKMRLPIPGGRHYVMPAAAGRRAGIQGLTVGRGEIRIDPRYGTAWVNDEDWLALEESSSGAGIAAILGGADHDDALWLYPFTDHDGARKVLAWRSPNQAGEYVVLRPTVDSAIPAWKTVDEKDETFPAGDSRRLPARIDRVDTDYLNLVAPATAGGLGEGEVYSVEVMEAAIDRALANRGALGMTCNSLMVNKAVFGRLPEKPPAPLEEIIDGAVKTGADLSRVVAWNYENSRQILEARMPVPALLHGRLSADYADRESRPPSPIASRDHWLDRLEAGVRGHIREMEMQRDELVARARPPEVLFASVASEPEAVALGARLNQTYAWALKRSPAAERLDVARRVVEDYLAHFPPGRREAVLRGALVSAYLGDRPVSDGAVWLAGTKGEGGLREAGVGHLTAGALRDIGLLDEVAET
ncbi:MAG: hypothetical protein RRC07_16630, partial [Anaerolineae bacterium]|nr:hypothetical protein [Anaerolineae bacterium]